MANPSKPEADLAKLVSAARALITNQVGFPIACARIYKLITWLDDAEINYPVFQAYASDTDDLPVGSERLLCERAAFFRFDERLEAVNAAYRVEVLKACFDILDRFETRDAFEST